MGRILSDEERTFFEDILSKYEPYDEDDPIMNQFDGEDKEPMRGMATLARKILREAETK